MRAGNDFHICIFFQRAQSISNLKNETKTKEKLRTDGPALDFTRIFPAEDSSSLEEISQEFAGRYLDILTGRQSAT